jgi:putative membrane protein
VTVSDPRVFFAAERTLLAWLRSSIAIIGLGIVVARFGLFLALLPGATTGSAQPHAHWVSGTLGIALVVLGSLSVIGALLNFRLFVRSIPREDRPQLALRWLTTVLALSIAIVGLLLALYLIVL